MGIFALLICMSITPSVAVDTVDESSMPISNGYILYVGGIGEGNYSSIQDAIDIAEDGDTVFVYDDSSPYNENIWINKSINLIGEDKYTTQINGSGEHGTSVVKIKADGVTIIGFNVENSGVGTPTPDSGIFVDSDNCKIINNIIAYNHYGICVQTADYSTISNNIIVDNLKVLDIHKSGVGIQIDSENNNISNNFFSNNHYNIGLTGSHNNIICNNKIIYAKTHSGIWAQFCDNNTIIRNNISYNCNRGIDLYQCKYNNISYNYIVENGEADDTQGDDGIMIRVSSRYNVVWGNYISRHWDYGLIIPYECYHNLVAYNTIENNYFTSKGVSIGHYDLPIYNNTFYHNNFINNTNGNAVDNGNGINYWNNSYLSGGNYWDDYLGVDDYHGPNQDIPGSDGIGDFPHYVPGNANHHDWYPLMEPWNIPPCTPNSPSPNNYDTDVSINTDLSWKGDDKYPGNKVTYDIYFGTSSSPSKVKSNHSSTRYNLDQLSISTTYYWKIVAWDKYGGSTEGPIWQFTTGAVDNDPPDIPSSPNPSDGEINVSIENSILEWAGGDPDDDIVTYDVYFGKNYFFHKVVGNQSDTNYSLGTLEFNKKYFWQIVAWDEHGDSTLGPIWSFRTVKNYPPYMPSDPEPEDGATDVDIEDVVLSWNCSDPEGHLLTYDVYFEDVLVSENQTARTFELWTLEYDTYYFWRIVAFDGYGGSAEGPYWGFTTTTEPNDAPYVPCDPGPENGSIDVDIDTILRWVGGDPDEGDTVFYDVYLEADNPVPNVKVADDLSEIWFDPGLLDYNTTYYWRIVARDNHYASTISPVWHFTTVVNMPPDVPSIDGLLGGKPGKYYSYRIIATDPEDHHVFYYIDWGDGTFEDWIGPYISGMGRNFTHAWEEEGKYLIKAKAKDVFDAESEWSTFEITIPKNKPFNFNFKLLERLLNRFPLLEVFLRAMNLLR